MSGGNRSKETPQVHIRTNTNLTNSGGTATSFAKDLMHSADFTTDFNA